MGRKINPNVFRSNNLTKSYSNWFDKKNYNEKIEKDFVIRKIVQHFFNKLNINLGYIEISRKELIINNLKIYKLYINIFILKNSIIQKITNKNKNNLIKKIEKSETSIINKNNIIINFINKSNKIFANYFLQNINEKIKKRINPKLVIKTYIQKIKKYKIIKGLRIQISGRINGKEKASNLNYTIGSLKLQTIDSKIDFAQKSIITKDGLIGIKIWLRFQ